MKRSHFVSFEASKPRNNKTAATYPQPSTWSSGLKADFVKALRSFDKPYGHTRKHLYN